MVVIGRFALFRIGEVRVGEAGVVIAASSPRRKQAQEAVSFMLDRLKTTVPVFKKELYDDGTGAWKENDECAWNEKRSEPDGQQNQR